MQPSTPQLHILLCDDNMWCFHIQHHYLICPMLIFVILYFSPYKRIYISLRANHFVFDYFVIRLPFAYFLISKFLLFYHMPNRHHKDLRPYSLYHNMRNHQVSKRPLSQSYRNLYTLILQYQPPKPQDARLYHA